MISWKLLHYFRVEDLLVKIEKIFADPETGAPSKALGLLGEKILEARLNRLEDQVGEV